MSVPRSVAEVFAKHVTLEVEGIDRMYLNVYVPALQRAGGVASFFRFHLGHRFASSALMDPITKGFHRADGEVRPTRVHPDVDLPEGPAQG